MQCVKPSIPRNSLIIYPLTDQVRYTHGTTIYLACHEGHLLTGSPIMVCNYTTWLKREFSCIGMFSPMRSHQSYIVWPPPLITTNINHKTHIAIKRNEKHLNRIITQESIFSPPALVATCGFCAGFDTCDGRGISRWSDCTHTTSQRNVNNSDPQALRLSRKKTGHMDQEKNCLVLQSRAPNWTSGGPKYFIPLKLYPNIK